MTYPGRALWYGFLLWLFPFAVAFAIFPLKRDGSPLFETIMALVVTLFAVVFINLYFQRVDGNFVREAVWVGLVWMAISLAVDLPMFMWGPMKKTLAEYMADIGLAYLAFPILTVGIGLLLQRRCVVGTGQQDELHRASTA